MHPATVSGFWMDATTVTSNQFRRFVKSTGYITVAERPPDAEDYPNALPELLVPGSAVFRKASGPVDLRYRPAARHPETIDTSTTHIGFRCIVRIGEQAQH